MSLLRPPSTQPFDVAQAADQMDFATEHTTRSPAMQDIDIDLELGDDFEPTKEDENMMEGTFDMEGLHTDQDDEMVDEVAQADTADEVIEDVPADPEDANQTPLEDHKFDQYGEAFVNHDVDALNFQLPTETELNVQLHSNAIASPSANEAHQPDPSAEAGLPAIGSEDHAARSELFASLQNPVDDANVLDQANLGSDAKASADVVPPEDVSKQDIAAHDQESESTIQGQYEDPDELANLGDYFDDTDPPIGATEAHGPDASTVGQDQGTADNTKILHEETEKGSQIEIVNAAKSQPGHGEHKPHIATSSHDEPEATRTTNNDDQVRQEAPSRADHIHPVTVHYQGSEMSLFSLEDDTEHSDAYLLSDTALTEKSLYHLFEACRSVLEEDISEHEILVISFASLSLDVHEGSEDAKTCSLAHILDIFVQLYQNEGVDHPGPLQMTIATRQRLYSSLQSLKVAADEGRGYSSVIKTIFQPTAREVDDSRLTDQDLFPQAQSDLANVAPQKSATNGTNGRGISKDSRATPPFESNVEVVDFALEFESPIKVPATAPHKDSQASGSKSDIRRSENAKSDPIGEQTFNDFGADPAEDSAADPLFGDEQDTLEGETERDFANTERDQPLEDTNNDSSKSHGRIHSITEGQTFQDQDHGDGEQEAVEEHQHSAFEDDLVFDENDEATTLEGAETAVLDSEPLALNEEQAREAPSKEKAEELDADSFLDDSAYLDDNDEADDSAGPSATSNGVEAAADDQNVQKEGSRKRHRSLEDDDVGESDNPDQSKRTRPS